MLTSLANLQRLILIAGLCLSAMLLVKFAIDFTTEIGPVIAAPFWLLVFTALAVALSNLIGRRSTRPRPEGTRLLLLSAIPLAFFASSLDCTGLSVAGCSPYCTFIKTIWIPLIAIACGAYFFAARDWLFLVISLMSFATLVPHCVCYNAGNGWWIERLGASPVCYVWGFVVSLISAGALLNGRRAWPSILINGAIICGAMGFFVAHHYFHFPW